MYFKPKAFLLKKRLDRIFFEYIFEHVEQF